MASESRSYLAAMVQMRSTRDREGNWEQARALVERAASQGAQLIATPENTNFLGPLEEKVKLAEPLDGPTVGRFSDLAKRLKVHLLLGSFNEKSTKPGQCRNTSVFFNPEGEILALYRKIHLFDVDLSKKVSFRESDGIEPGADVVTIKTSLGSFGLSICYDLRFPELYQKLAAQGADILTVPSAFTLTTGRDHWHTLLRARAIEQQCYVLAPAQHGPHDENGTRESFGHSMIVDPWGHIVAMASDGIGSAMAVIDLDRVDQVRRALPVALHRRLDWT